MAFLLLLLLILISLQFPYQVFLGLTYPRGLGRYILGWSYRYVHKNRSERSACAALRRCRQKVVAHKSYRTGSHKACQTGFHKTCCKIILWLILRSANHQWLQNQLMIIRWSLESTNQRLNKLMKQQSSKVIKQFINHQTNKSINHPINNSTNQQINKQTSQWINKSTQKQFDTSTIKHIHESTHQQINK